VEWGNPKEKELGKGEKLSFNGALPGIGKIKLRRNNPS